MDQLLTVMIGLSYVIAPVSLGAMGYVGYRLVREQQKKRRERP
jgi:hypothetical protein